MKHYTKHEFDNRDTGQVYEYMEARIEALKRRILQLEHENETMRWADGTAPNASLQNNQVSA
jgi:hypothetical protein